MRKKMLLLALSLTALAGSLSYSAQAAGTHACPICTHYTDGTQCCRSCVCNDQNVAIGCTQNFCPPFH